MEQATFWSRVGHWLKASRPGDSDRISQVAPSSLIDVPNTQTTIESSPAPVEAGGSGTKLRLTRTGSAIERLEEEYTRVVNIVESVQKHLEQQGERAESMAGSLTRLAESLEHLPDTSKTQLEHLTRINHQMGVDGACVKRVEENLSQLPRLADAQRETMVSIGRQLDLSRQANDRVAATLDGFQQAVTLLSEATGTSTKVLQDIRWDASAREERVAAILREQTRRLTIFAAAAGAATIVVGLIGIIALLRS